MNEVPGEGPATWSESSGWSVPRGGGWLAYKRQPDEDPGQKPGNVGVDALDAWEQKKRQCDEEYHLRCYQGIFKESKSAFDREYFADALKGFAEARKSLPAGLDDSKSKKPAAFFRVRLATPVGGYDTKDAVAMEKVEPMDDSLSRLEFLIAECHYRLSQYVEAVEGYRRVYRESRPSESTLQTTFTRIYMIALDYLNGKAGASILHLIPYRGPGYGVDMLVGDDPSDEGVITEYPLARFDNGESAEDAIMAVAEYYYSSRKYQDAERYFKRVATEYGSGRRSEFAEYQLAMSVYRQIRGPDYDQQLMQNAESHFLRYLQRYPRRVEDRAREARARLDELRQLMADSYLRKAKYYLAESQVEAAKIYLRIVKERYEATEAGREAIGILRQIERVEEQG